MRMIMLSLSSVQLSPANPLNHSRSSMARCGKTFYWAARFLSLKTANKAYALYALCRRFDDIADGDMHNKLAVLDAMHVALSKASSDKLTINASLAVSKRALTDLLAGFCFDQRSVALRNSDELLQYCYQVAGTVGVMMCNVLAVNDRRALPFAIHLGIALQLTNIARDVGEDAAMGRRYLPASWVHDYTADHIADLTQPDAVLLAANKRLLGMADQYYRSGLKGLRYLPRGSRFAIFLAAKLYRAIGINLRWHRYNNLSYRAQLNPALKVAFSLLALLQFALHGIADAMLSAWHHLTSLAFARTKPYRPVLAGSLFLPDQPYAF